MKSPDDVESVHLANWPVAEGKEDGELLSAMERVRTLASEALMLRQKANLKVRQPLASLSIPGELTEAFAALLIEEVNVKQVLQHADTLSLDTVLTPELIQEGDERELSRAVAEARKALNLSPRDKAEVVMNTDGVYSVELSTGKQHFDLKLDAA